MNGVPPIVLFVGMSEKRGGSHTEALEAAGFWVARSASPADVADDIIDLRPDVVIADVSDAEREAGADALVQTLTSTAATRGVPLVVVDRAAAAERPRPEMGAVHVSLPAPVSPPALRDAVERVLAAARAGRDGAAGDRSVDEIVASPKPDVGLAPAQPESGSRAHRCPSCAGALVWVERSTVAGAEYDYFQWCGSGCGLYCLAVATAQWVKLA